MSNDQYLIEDELKIHQEMIKVFAKFAINNEDLLCPPKEFWPEPCIKGEEIIQDIVECQDCICRYIRSIAIKNLEKVGIKLRKLYD